MLSGDQTLSIIIKAKDEATKVLSTLQDNVKKAGDGMTSAGKKLSVGLTAPLTAIGVGAFKAASDFEQSMSNVSTLLDTTKENMDEMKNHVLSLAKEMPVPIDELTTSLYDIRSAGISADQAMSTLESAGKLAVGGLGSTREATDILTSALNSFSKQGLTSAQTADVFVKSVFAGKTTVSALAQGFGQVAPLASQLGVSLQDLMGTTSAMTTSGMSASIAYTQIRAVLSGMLKPTADMEEAMKKVGITSENLTDWLDEQGLTGVVRALSEAVGGDQGELAKMFGSVEALNAVMMLNNETGDNAVRIFRDMRTGSSQLDEAFNKQNQTAQSQYQTMKNELNVAMIDLGTTILPTLKTVMEELTQILERVTNWFMSLSPETQKMVLIATGLVAILGPLLVVLGSVVTVISAAATAIAGMTLTAGIVIGVIAGLIAVGVLLYKHWDEVKAKATELWTSLKVGFRGMVNGIIAMFEGWANAVVTAVNTIVGALNKIKVTVPDWVPKYGGKSFGISLPMASYVSLPRYEHGGIVQGARGEEVPAILHGGEQVIPASGVSGSGVYSFNVTINNPNVRSKEDARTLKEDIDKALRDVIRIHKLQSI